MNYNSTMKERVISLFGSQRNYAGEIGERETKVSAVIRGRWNLTEAEKRRWAKPLRMKPEEVFGE